MSREYVGTFDIKLAPEDLNCIRIVERIVRENMEDAIGWAKGVVQNLNKYYPGTKLIEVKEVTINAKQP